MPDNKMKWVGVDPRKQPGDKECKSCGKKQPRTSYAVGRDRSDGLQPYCNNCRWKKYREDPRAQLIITARKRAKLKGREFNLSKEDIVIPSHCPILGIPLEIVTGKGQHDGSPSIDRVDNSGGYTKDNVRIISWRANNIKKYATIDDLEKILTYMRENSNG